MKDYSISIQDSGYSIYDDLAVVAPDLYIPTEVLELMLRSSLIGMSLEGLPLRTRSKRVKIAICSALGYSVPDSFKKTQPRFKGQNFDVYIQKSNNIQIWNEEISPLRRYVLIGVNEADIVYSVKVITGDQLSQYDKTGTLTKKYQASMKRMGRNICSESDTEILRLSIDEAPISYINANPNDSPSIRSLMPICEVYNRLVRLVGEEIEYMNSLQERNRGAALHAAVCRELGYASYQDNGSYPDILHQLLEIKLQTSPTIDLGLHSPSDDTLLWNMDNIMLSSRDIRYAIFDGTVLGDKVRINNLYLVTGSDFENHFPLFKGRVRNAKLQFPLPKDFFH